MDRRTLLKLLAATALVGCHARPGAGAGRRVVVAGAGIIGASIAYHLARAGAQVTIIDQEGPATHASRGTFAWINATWAKQPRFYHQFNQLGVANWHELEQSLGLPVRWGGSLEWFSDLQRQKLLASQIAEQVRWGEPARMVDVAELAVLEPGVHFGHAVSAAYSPNDGAVDPVLATGKLLNAAQTMGAQVHYPSTLMDVQFSTANRLVSVTTSTGVMPADSVVLATGAAAQLPVQIAGVDIPQRSRPGIIAITEPLPRLLRRVISAPGIHMHQRGDGRVVLGEQDGAPQTQAHALRLAGRPNNFPTRALALQHGQRMLGVAQMWVPEIRAASIEDVYIGWRPLPIDGHPVIGRSPRRPDVYLALMHSGVSLAPIVGHLAALELTQGIQSDRLGEYRPGRTFKMVMRY